VLVTVLAWFGVIALMMALIPVVAIHSHGQIVAKPAE
jgi:hypothetical protein